MQKTENKKQKKPNIHTNGAPHKTLMAHCDHHTNGALTAGAPLECQSTWIYMAPGRHTNGAPWPILMAHPRCAISIPDTNGAPGGAPLVKITNGVLVMAHH